MVGGAVRDLLLGMTPSDWDVASDCLPEQVLTLFDRTIATGLQHGTVTALVGHGAERENVEITTFRGEGAYTDGRHPDSVSFGVPLLEDLKRRDFVINAMAFDPVAGCIHDPFGGQSDLQSRRVRAVGEASERFIEDGLRVMRAVRFVSTLDFSLEEATEKGLACALESLAKVAQERVRVELLKLLGGKAPRRALEIAERNGVLQVILPELGPDKESLLFTRVALLEADPILRLAALLSALDSSSVEPVLRRLTMSNSDCQRILAMLRLREDFPSSGADEATMRRHLSAVGRKAAVDQLAILNARGTQESDQGLLAAVKLARRLLDSGAALETGELAIHGARVMASTGAKGPAVGHILRALLERVLDDPSCNNTETLERLAIEMEDYR